MVLFLTELGIVFGCVRHYGRSWEGCVDFLRGVFSECVYFPARVIGPAGVLSSLLILCWWSLATSGVVFLLFCLSSCVHFCRSDFQFSFCLPSCASCQLWPFLCFPIELLCL